MATFRMIHTEFWSDPKVVEEMTPEDKYFYLYLLTNPNTKQIGIYQITKKQMAFDIGYSIESINALLDRFINNHELVRYNIETRELAIKNWGKYNFIRGGKPVEDLVRKELDEVKDKELIEYVADKILNEKIKGLYMESLQGEGYFEPSKIYKPSPNEKITANKYVLWRDRQTCFYTGLVLQKKDVHIDHIVPKTDGGSGTPDNLVVSYAKFNNFKSGTNDLEVVVNAWNEKYTNLQIDMDVLKRKIFHLKEFEKTRIENEVSYRETINNNIYDTYTLRNYLDTTRGQYKQQQEEEEEKEEEEQDVAEIIQFWDNNGFGYNNINAKTQLLSWLNNSLFKNPKEMILEAMNIACASNKRRLNYIEGILRNWLNESILTLEEAKSSNGKPNKQYKDEVDWDNL